MRALQRGMTLVELLVAMSIGLIVTLVLSSLLVTGENHKRTTTSTNDAEQTGNYVLYALDRALRGAGSALVQSTLPSDRGVLGCKLNVAGILPRATAFPAPFATAFLAGATNNLRVAPLLIGKSQSDGGSDVLVVMGGSGAAGGVPRPVNGSGTSTSLVLQNAVGFTANDIALVSQSGTTDCLLEEIQSVATPTLTLGGTYYTANGTATDLGTLAASTSTYVTPLGNAQANNVQFQLIGVGTDNILYSYDLLQNQLKVQGTGTDSSQAIADGVIQLNALYGLQNAATPGVLDHWASPDVSPYDINTVMTTPAIMESIIAVHVAVVVRGEYYDKKIVSPATLTIFSGYTNGAASLSQTVNLDDTSRHYRYRVFEFTVPLRNMLLVAGGT